MSIASGKEASPDHQIVKYMEDAVNARSTLRTTTLPGLGKPALSRSAVSATGTGPGAVAAGRSAISWGG